MFLNYKLRVMFQKYFPMVHEKENNRDGSLGSIYLKVMKRI